MLYLIYSNIEYEKCKNNQSTELIFLEICWLEMWGVLTHPSVSRPTVYKNIPNLCSWRELGVFDRLMEQNDNFLKSRFFQQTLRIGTKNSKWTLNNRFKKKMYLCSVCLWSNLPYKTSADPSFLWDYPVSWPIFPVRLSL